MVPYAGLSPPIEHGTRGQRERKGNQKVYNFVGWCAYFRTNWIQKGYFWNMESRRSWLSTFIKTIRTWAFLGAVQKKKSCFMGTILANSTGVSESHTAVLTISLKVYVNRPADLGWPTFTSKQGTEPGKTQRGPSNLFVPLEPLFQAMKLAQHSLMSTFWEQPSILSLSKGCLIFTEWDVQSSGLQLLILGVLKDFYPPTLWNWET